MKQPFNSITLLALPALLLGLLTAGCGESSHSHRHRATLSVSRNHYKPGDGSINVENDEVLIRAGGTQADAKVGVDGALSIGNTLIDLSPEGRSALKQYDADAVAIKQHGIALGVAGAQLGLKTAKEVLHGLIDGTAEEAGKRAEQGANELVSSARELCSRLDGMYQSQQSAAAKIPEFVPYAVIAEHQVRDCFEDEKVHVKNQRENASDEPGTNDGDDADPADKTNETDKANPADKANEADKAGGAHAADGKAGPHARRVRLERKLLQLMS